MKVTIITVVRNNAATIEDAIKSVMSQSYANIEYIIIDGCSNDGTVERVLKYKDQIARFLSEPDDGLYDAMNKGIKLATGDIIGILNSDDFYANEFVLEGVVNQFKQMKVDSVFADLVYVSSRKTEKIVRYYDSSKFDPSRFAYGWMPAHPTFFVKKKCYEDYGVFRTDLKIAADFDLLVRFLATNKVSYSYIPEVLVKMRVGGVSTSLRSTWRITKEQLRVCRENYIDTNIFKILSKYVSKLSGFFRARSAY